MKKYLKKLKNLTYLGKWIFRRKWYKSVFYLDIYEYKQTGKKKLRESRRITKMKNGEIEGILHWVKYFRDKGFYKISDHFRNKLITIGYYWKEPKKWNASNLLGHTLSGLDYKIIENEHYIEGEIFSNSTHSGREIGYSTKYITPTKVEITPKYADQLRKSPKF